MNHPISYYTASAAIQKSCGVLGTYWENVAPHDAATLTIILAELLTYDHLGFERASVETVMERWNLELPHSTVSEETIVSLVQDTVDTADTQELKNLIVALNS